MPAYVIVNVKVTDAEGYKAYAAGTPAAIAAYRGRYLARGGRTEVREGDYEPARVVVLEFPTMDDARAWYESPEYQEILPIRQACAVTDLFLVEGVEDDT